MRVCSSNHSMCHEGSETLASAVFLSEMYIKKYVEQDILLMQPYLILQKLSLVTLW